MKYKISQLARRCGLSRSTLLYYDRIGLLTPVARSAAGYRLYDEKDRQRLEAIRTYRQAGLTMEEIGRILDCEESPDAGILGNRLEAIAQQIRSLQAQQRVLSAMLKAVTGDFQPHDVDKKMWTSMLAAAGMDEAAMGRWHMAFETEAPKAHHAFLLSLGITEKEAHEIRARARSHGHKPSP